MAFKKNAFDESFITPMSEQRLAAEPGPDIFSIPVLEPKDVFGVIPAGSKGKGIGNTGMDAKSKRGKGRGE